MSRGRAVVARQAHNLKVGGSIPPPATKKHRKNLQVLEIFYYYFRPLKKSSIHVPPVPLLHSVGQL